MKILLKIVNHYRGSTNFYHHGKEVKTPFFCMETERPFSTSTLSPRGAREALNFLGGSNDRKPEGKSTCANTANVF